MSLCPNYCECPVCEHHQKACEGCRECLEKTLVVIRQQEHEESVRKQKARTRHPKVLEVR